MRQVTSAILFFGFVVLGCNNGSSPDKTDAGSNTDTVTVPIPKTGIDTTTSENYETDSTPSSQGEETDSQEASDTHEESSSELIPSSSDTDEITSSTTPASAETGSNSDTDQGTDTVSDNPQETDTSSNTSEETDTLPQEDSDTLVDAGQTPDGGGEVDSDAGTDTESPQEECPLDESSLSFTYISTGGFSGSGNGDFSLGNGVLTVKHPAGGTCAGTANNTQMASLVSAAQKVDWLKLDADYTYPNNPGCCCDFFIYDMTLTTPSCQVAVHWCGESEIEENGQTLLPTALLNFANTIETIGMEVWSSCP